MKSYFVKYTVIFCLILIAFGCRVHEGNVTSTPERSDFAYVDHVNGYNAAKYWFSIGGLNKTALVDEAKREMYRSRPLKQHEAYANITVDMQRTYIFIFIKMEVFVSADIIDFSRNGENRYSSKYEDYLKTSEIEKGPSPFALFNEGDTVMTKDEMTFVVSKVGYTKMSAFGVNDPSASILTYDLVFKTSGTFNGKTVGKSFTDPNGIDYTIIAVGLEQFLVKDETGHISRMAYYDN